ncbi:MAG: glycosyl hydrolase [Lachnospiraceae bacterium]
MDEKIWKDPKAEKSLDYSQSPLWFWNDKLEHEELVRQLEMMTNVGVTSTIPHARGNMGEGYIGGYLDEEWFEKIHTVLKYKRAHGEPCWLYDEFDWPAGTCNKTITKEEKYREQYISFQKYELREGEEFRCQLTDYAGKPMFTVTKDTDLREYCFNVYILDANGQKQDIMEFLVFSKFGPTVEFVAAKDLVVYIAEIRIDPYEMGGAEAVNYLDDKATKAFLNSTYEPYYERFSEYFGSTIKAVFNDETRMCHAFAWSSTFAAEFSKEKGYDLLPLLVDLVLPGEEAGRTRCDYFDVLAGLYQKNYFGVLRQWCEEHDIALYAHLLGEETLAAQVRFSGDMMRQYRYMTWPGLDHLGKGIGSLNAKFGDSASRSYGLENYGVEVFAGCGWELTFEEYIRMICWMFQQGLQVIINHGFFYSTRGRRKDDWPPSQFVQWQGYERMEEGNALVRRLHYALSGGTPEVDVLIYHPTEAFWMHYIGDEKFKHGYARGPLIKGDRAALIDRELQIFLNEMSQCNIDFDMFHKDVLAHYEVVNGKIRNTCNGEEYKVLVLPMCDVLPYEAVELLSAFAEAGGQIIALEGRPNYAMPKERDEDLRCEMQRLIQCGKIKLVGLADKKDMFAEIAAIIDAPVKIIEGRSTNQNNHLCYEKFLEDPYMHGGEDLTGISFIRYRKDKKRITYFMNYGNKPEEITVALAGAKSAQLWNPLTGDITIPQSLESAMENTASVRFTVPSDFGVLLVTEVDTCVL